MANKAAETDKACSADKADLVIWPTRPIWQPNEADKAKAGEANKAKANEADKQWGQ